MVGAEDAKEGNILRTQNTTNTAPFQIDGALHFVFYIAHDANRKLR